MNYERLSSNIICIIDEVLKNQILVNYLATIGNDPSTSSPIPKATIAPMGANERVFPYPFDISYKEDIRSQLHIYYPKMTFENNGNAGMAYICFDIVVHKNIWLLKDKGKKIIRPYQIATLILESLKGKQIEGVGKIHFLEADHTVINEKFEGIRLVATVTEF